MKVGDLSPKKIAEFTLPVLTAGIENQGLNNYAPRDNATILKNVISISANGANTGATFYQNKEFTVLQDAYAISFKEELPNDNQYLFLTGAIAKSIYGNFAWTDKAGWEKVKKEFIQLPTKDGKIDFEFMDACIRELEEERIRELEEERIRELSAYLTVSGLDNYKLSSEEKEALENLKSVQWKEYNLEKLFGKSTRGKRLKSDDRVNGSLPFITAGEANTGISDFIGNEVEVFSKNTITIDMFGSAKYRNYNYGGDDHIAIVHTEKIKPESAIFVTSAIHKSSYNGQFNYGHNFYAKDADALNIMLPTKDGKIDFEFMELLISAVQKLVIKDVILYADEKIQSTKKIVKES